MSLANSNQLRRLATTTVVLRTYKFGESDRIIVLLSQDRGKIRAVAKGVRKSGSRFGSRLEPSSCLEVELYRNKSELYTIVGATSVAPYRKIREDMPRLLKAYRMLEIADHITLDDVPHPGLFKILKGALDTLETGNSDMLLAGFLWRVLQNEGMAPPQECAVCGATDRLVNYNVLEGGLTCAEHAQGVPINPKMLAALREILGGRLNQALQRSDTTVAAGLEQLAERVLQAHSERPLRSLSDAKLMNPLAVSQPTNSQRPAP